MKKLVGIFSLALVALLFMSMYSGSGSGIKFENLTFEQAKAKAKKSGKLIFIDAYTDWCGPCKRMAATSFKDERVAKVYNDQFINLKVEMEKSKDGPEIARLYKVRAYPTVMIIDGDGKLVKQAIGLQSADRLLMLAESVE